MSFLSEFKEKQKTSEKIKDIMSGQRDMRIYKPKYDVEHTVTMRPIPHYDFESKILTKAVPFFRHNMDWKGKYANIDCPKTMGKENPCPVCEYVYGEDLYNKDEKKYKAFKRSKKVAMNVLIINDPLNPENNGKVFILEAGVQIMKKFEAAEKEDIDVWDMFEGVNFKLVVEPGTYGPSYDSSMFEMRSTSIADDEETLKDILKRTHDITSIYKTDVKFLTPDEINAKLERLLGESTKPKRTFEEDAKEDKTVNSFDSDVIESDSSDSGDSDDDFDIDDIDMDIEF